MGLSYWCKWTFRVVRRGLAVVLTLGLGGVLLTLDACVTDQPHQCPASECFSDACHGSQVLSCDVTSAVDYDGNQCVNTGTWVPGKDCATLGADCREGVCVSKTERCPPETVGFCRDGQVFACVGDRVPLEGRACGGDDGTSCFDVTRGGGLADAVCALTPYPCANYGSACIGNSIASCPLGYPISETACPAGQSCRQWSQDEAYCTTDGGT